MRRMGAFNLSLLGKWCWRMLVEKDGLWHRVLKARYGEVWGRLKEGSSHCSTWWRSMCRIREGLGEGVGRWFANNIRHVVGDDNDTFFWHNIWVGEVPLKLKFPRLYELALNKKWSVAEAKRDIGADGGGERVWRRHLFVWDEESVRECSILLYNTVLQDNVHDAWCWLLDLIHGYSVKGAYHYLATTDDSSDRTTMMSGKSIFHLRCLCSCGGFSVIDFLRKIIWCSDKSFPLQIRFVLQVVEGWKRQHICSYTLTYSALFGIMFGAGYIFLRCPLVTSDNILFNSLQWRGCLDSLIHL